MNRRRIRDSLVVHKLYKCLTECVPRVRDFISSTESPYEIIESDKTKWYHSKSVGNECPTKQEPERFPMRAMTCDAISSKAFLEHRLSSEVLFHFLSTRSTRSVIFGCCVRRYTNSTVTPSAPSEEVRVDKIAVMVVSPLEMYLVSPLHTHDSFFGHDQFPNQEPRSHYKGNFDVNIGSVVFGYWNNAMPVYSSENESQNDPLTNSRSPTEAAESSISDCKHPISKESFESVSFIYDAAIRATTSNYTTDNSLEQVEVSRPIFEAWDWVCSRRLMKIGAFKDRYNALDLWIRSLHHHDQKDHKHIPDLSKRGMRIKLKTSLPISIYRPWIRQLKISKQDETHGPFSMCAFFSTHGCLGETLRWTNVSLIRLQCSVYQESIQSSIRDPLQDQGECNLLLQTADKYNIGKVLPGYTIGVKGMQSYRVFPKHIQRTCVFEMRIENYPIRSAGFRNTTGSDSRCNLTEPEPTRKCIVLTFVPNSITNQSAIKANVLTSIVKRMSKQISLNDLYNSLSGTEPSYSAISKCALGTIRQSLLPRSGTRKRSRDISLQNQTGEASFRPRRRSSRILARQSNQTIRGPSRPTKNR